MVVKFEKQRKLVKTIHRYKNNIKMYHKVKRLRCWPLVPKFAGSNTAETVGFLGRKNPQHAFFRRGSKAVGPMS